MEDILSVPHAGRFFYCLLPLTAIEMAAYYPSVPTGRNVCFLIDWHLQPPVNQSDNPKGTYRQ